MIQSRPYKPNPSACCEGCVFGGDRHAIWCDNPKLVVPSLISKETLLRIGRSTIPVNVKAWTKDELNELLGRLEDSGVVLT